jgi:hypothetical protein
VEPAGARDPSIMKGGSFRQQRAFIIAIIRLQNSAGKLADCLLRLAHFALYVKASAPCSFHFDAVHRVIGAASCLCSSLPNERGTDT